MLKKIFLFLLLLSNVVFAAVGCDLNDPDRDVKRFFPDYTTYKTDYVSVKEKGGEKLLTEIETKLGSKFQGLYETIDVPYTIYTIYKNNAIIGYIHGINQKGEYGGIQVFLVYEPNLVIKNFYLQKLTSKNAKEYRDSEFSKQFIQLSFNDFKNYEPESHNGGSAKVKAIKDISEQKSQDFYAILRAVKKNLILSEIFIK